MSFLANSLKWAASCTFITAIGIAGWLYFAPPDLIRVGTNYSAKMVCSNVFIAGRNADEILQIDVQAPGHPILKLISINIDQQNKIVRASLLGLFGEGMAAARDGLGCANVPSGTIDDLRKTKLIKATPQTSSELKNWPAGTKVQINSEIQDLLEKPALTGEGMRAVVVVKNGEIIGEKYGVGFDQTTPLLGWSMTKSVTSAIIGTLIKEELLTLNQNSLFEHWYNDARKNITISSLLSMSSGLSWNEGYGDVSDVTRMLYLTPDMAKFVTEKPIVAADEPTKNFNYSSGTTVALSRIWQNAAGAKAMDWPHEKLFKPLGMTSAVLEADASGTFSGSSYLYANARDWARFGQLFLQKGNWNGTQIISSDYVNWATAPAKTSNAKWGKPEYANAHFWLHGPTAKTPEGQNPDSGFSIPDDAYWMLGHDGQSITIIPSKNLVVVRLGLTPSKIGYKPQALIAALTK